MCHPQCWGRDEDDPNVTKATRGDPKNVILEVGGGTPPTQGPCPPLGTGTCCHLPFEQGKRGGGGSDKHPNLGTGGDGGGGQGWGGPGGSGLGGAGWGLIPRAFM